jgi:hypothetical protein
MNFKMLSGDVNWRKYGGKFVSKKLNNGDFDYWLVMEVINWLDATGDDSQGKYVVSLSAISPDSVSKENLNRALESTGLTGVRKLDLVLALSDYGIYAPLWNESGDNLKVLLKEAHKQAILSSGLFGFYMDRPKNRLGQTGWNLIAGETGWNLIPKG